MKCYAVLCFVVEESSLLTNWSVFFLCFSPLLTKTFGPRVTKPPSDGSVNPRSSTAVLPCLLSLVTLFSRTLFSHGHKLLLAPHTHLLTSSRNSSGMPFLLAPSGKSLPSFPCSNFGTSVVVEEPFLITPRDVSLDSTHLSIFSVIMSTLSLIFSVSYVWSCWEVYDITA
jgi:hypothetical protein